MDFKAKVKAFQGEGAKNQFVSVDGKRVSVWDKVAQHSWQIEKIKPPSPTQFLKTNLSVRWGQPRRYYTPFILTFHIPQQKIRLKPRMPWDTPTKGLER